MSLTWTRWCAWTCECPPWPDYSTTYIVKWVTTGMYLNFQLVHGKRHILLHVVWNTSQLGISLFSNRLHDEVGIISVIRQGEICITTEQLKQLLYSKYEFQLTHAGCGRIYGFLALFFTEGCIFYAHFHWRLKIYLTYNSMAYLGLIISYQIQKVYVLANIKLYSCKCENK